MTHDSGEVSLADRESVNLQHVVDQISGRLTGESLGRVAAALAAHPGFRALHDVPAFIEWVAREISHGHRPTIEPEGPRRHDTAALGIESALHRGIWLPTVPGSMDATQWDELLARVLARRDIEPFVQPIVDLRRSTVVGYEAFARFSGPAGLPAELWFAEADKRGIRSELEALALHVSLRRLSDAPRGCFLSLNVSPRALIGDDVQRVLAGAGDLHRVAIELTVPAQTAEISELARRVAALKEAGATLVLSRRVDEETDEELRALRPSVLKLTEPFVSAMGGTNGEEDLGEALMSLAGRIGARIIVQNVERMEDLLVLRQRGIRFVQGFLVGVPTTNWQPLASELRAASPR